MRPPRGLPKRAMKLPPTPKEETNGWASIGKNDIIKAFTNALFETYRNLANYGIVVSNLATVDAPGCDYIAAKRIMSTAQVVFPIRRCCIHNFAGSKIYSYRRGL